MNNIIEDEVSIFGSRSVSCITEMLIVVVILSCMYGGCRQKKDPLLWNRPYDPYGPPFMDPLKFFSRLILLFQELVIVLLAVKREKLNQASIQICAATIVAKIYRTAKHVISPAWYTKRPGCMSSTRHCGTSALES